MSNMVYLIHFSPWILDKIQAGVSSISEFLVKSDINKNYHNSRNCDELGPPSKLESRYAMVSNSLTITPCLFYDLWPICSNLQAEFQSMAHIS